MRRTLNSNVMCDLSSAHVHTCVDDSSHAPFTRKVSGVIRCWHPLSAICQLIE